MSDGQGIGFEIDGTFYEMPLIGSFDMDENRIFKQQTGLHAEEAWLGLQEGGGLSFADLMRNDGFLTALAHIAYRRENDGVADDQIAAMIGKVNRIELFASLVASMAEDTEDAPLESGTQTKPNDASTNSPSSKPDTTLSEDESSGTSSGPSSAPLVDDHVTIGITGSDTPSTSAQIRRVV